MKIVTQEELKVILSEHNIWLQGEGGQRANLSDANLIGADLRYANLSGANLRGADLSDANLIGADLRYANLRYTNLSGANLRGADLIDANLSGANLRGADLSGANLRGADLIDANLSGANLRGADLRGADLSDANLIGADLRYANLSGANLSVIKRDYFDVLIKGIPELINLRNSIINGMIDGSTYQGECACLCGTLEKSNNTSVKTVIFDQRDSSRPIERFFLGISKGDTPETNQFSKLALIWLDEFIETIKPYVKEDILK